MRRKLLFGVLGVTAVAIAAVVVWRLAGPTDPTSAARADLLSTPQEVHLELSIDIPKGSESDNPDHQEISASGVVDLAAGTGELVYDFNGLNNAAGFLGHFDTMDVLLGNGALYMDVFIDGPPWVRVVPDDIGHGDVGRLHDIFFTNPLALASYLEALGQGDGSEVGGQITPDALAGADDPFGAAIGETLREWAVETIEVELSDDNTGPLELVVSFAYRPDGIAGRIDLRATYELQGADSPPIVEVPEEDDTRAFSDIFGTT